MTAEREQERPEGPAPAPEGTRPKTLTILLNRGPFISEQADLAVNLALAAAHKGHRVRLYLYIDGVWVPHVRQDKPFSNVGESLKWALRKGVEVKSCARCATEARDITAQDMIPGIPLVGIFTLVDWLKDSDRTITFTG